MKHTLFSLAFALITAAFFFFGLKERAGFFSVFFWWIWMIGSGFLSVVGVVTFFWHLVRRESE